MEIKDLEPRQGKVDLVATVVEKEEPRDFEKFGKSGKVCNATIKDESGTVKLTLWNEQVEQVNVGDKIQMTNGYVSEWQGEKQLSAGKFGKLEVIEKSQGTDTPSPEPEEPKTEDEILEEDIVEDDILEKE